MIKFIKQLFCRHKSAELNRWHVYHGINGMNPAEIEAEYICKDCGKVFYRCDSIKNIKQYEKICNQYERIINND